MAKAGSPVWEIWLLSWTILTGLSVTFANIHFRGDRFVTKFSHANLEAKFHAMVVDDTEESETDSDTDTFGLPTFYNREKRDDDKCYEQEQKNLGAIAEGKSIHAVHSFANDSNHGLALTWCGEGGYGSMIAVTTSNIDLGISVVIKPSVVYLSVDGGKSFKNITDDVGSTYIKKGNGLQRNPHQSNAVYIVAHPAGSKKFDLYTSRDGGRTFNNYVLPANIDKPFHFHPDSSNPYFILAISTARTLYVSFDNGASWKKIADDVKDFKWGTKASEGDNGGQSSRTIYVLENTVDSTSNWFDQILNTPRLYNLKKTNDGGTSWRTISKVYSFGLEDKFLYGSVEGKKPGQRLMQVSLDGGKHWNETLLPTIINDQFYSILDSSEDMVFLHVDNPGDTGHGTLYTSAAEGVVYSVSLEKHLYPNGASSTDFYKVDSLRGVYIASQMAADDSIHSVISYDRGGEWKPIPRPEGTKCKDEAKKCTLQLHNIYSQSRGIKAEAPLSVESATGVILAHGHVADSLQTTPPDVFLTEDGGYSWRKVLDGPHHYQIADSGGLLLAIPMTQSNTVTYLKFSLDMGHCWHTYNFTSDPIIYTGLLTEPGSLSLNIGVWGFGQSDRVWQVHTIDFGDLITNKCQADDYDLVTIHKDLHGKGDNPEQSGCLLGMRETFQRLKADSWCKNEKTVVPPKNQEICKCTTEDYECEFGFYRPPGSDTCQEEPEFKTRIVDICLNGNVDKIITKGYRKIPGDKCTGGLQYVKDKFINMNEKCNPEEKSIILEEVKSSYVKKILEEEEPVTKPPEKSSSKRFLIVVAISLVVLGLIVFMTLFFVCRYYSLRRHQVTYRYSLLNQTDEQDFDGDLENVLSSGSTVYIDSDDEERTSSQRSQSNGRVASSSTSRSSTAPRQSNSLPKVMSYHDDSDVDMLE